MSKHKLPEIPTIALFILQVIALLLYSPAYFQRSPQAIVMPPALLILFVLALVGINSEAMSLSAGRSLLVFVQGINIVVRMITLFPNLKAPDGNWAWALLLLQGIGIAISWYTMLKLESFPMQTLKLKKINSEAG
jgi:hypothetical protein